MSSSIPETSIKYIYVYVMWVSRHASASRPYVDGRLWSKDGHLLRHLTKAMECTNQIRQSLRYIFHILASVNMVEIIHSDS